MGDTANQTPPILFRFYPAPEATQYASKNLASLRDGFIRLTCATEVNDIFECQPHYLDDLTPSVCQKYLESLQNQGIVPPKFFAATGISSLRSKQRRQKAKTYEYVKQHLKAGNHAALRLCGFICLAENLSSPVMWAHYASNHTGLCAGFSNDGLLFPSASMPVDYARERHTISLSASLIDFKRPEIFLSILTTKCHEWSYEKEWRFFGYHPEAELFLDGGEMIDFNCETLRKIYFGYRASKEFKGKTISEFTARYDRLEFYDMKPSSRSYAMEPVPIRN